MRHIKRMQFLWIVLAAISAISASGDNDKKTPVPPAVSIQGSILTVSGITPRGAVAINAAALRPLGDVSAQMLRIEEVVTDTDGDGVVTYDLGSTIPSRSIWAAVDVTTGGYAIAVPPNYPRRELPFPAESLKNTPPEEFDQLTHHSLLLQVLWVQPGQGAWMGMTADGGAGDSDGKNNGSTVTSLAHLHPKKGGVAVPKKIRKDDVLIFIDPFEMSFTSTRVVK